MLRVPSAAGRGTTMDAPALKSKFKVFVVLPAYNEEANIGGLLERIDSALTDAWLNYTVIVVDDGSRDRTQAILKERAERIPLIIKLHEVNQGLGRTIRDGLLAAAEMAGDQDIVVTMDADESHMPGLIPRMVQMLREGRDVVIASRYQPGAAVRGVSAFRRVLSFGASWLMRIFHPTPGVKDYTCGFRAYDGAALRRLAGLYGEKLVEAQGFQCMAELLLKFRKHGAIFAEAPMVLRYDLKRGESKMKILRTVGRTLRLLVKGS